jgi:hypothetical protein
MAQNSRTKASAVVKRIHKSQLHPRATKLIKRYSEKYQETLRLESQILASRSDADIVLSHHVEEAYNRVNSRESSWKQEFMIVIGGALLGTFIQGFITEINSTNSILIAAYTILGFVGMFLIFHALRK